MGTFPSRASAPLSGAAIIPANADETAIIRQAATGIPLILDHSFGTRTEESPAGEEPERDWGSNPVLVR